MNESVFCYWLSSKIVIQLYIKKCYVLFMLFNSYNEHISMLMSQFFECVVVCIRHTN